MQYFGEIETKYDEIFLTSSYMYFNYDDEVITAQDLKNKIKTKKDIKKNIIGTIFIYNPLVTPVGFDSNKYLLEQDFDQFDKMIELKCETYITIFKNAMEKQCKGKIVEIKNLFNLIEKNINASSLLMKFDADLEKYYTMQNTEFEREIMYFDAQTFIPNGKFVFFAWGEKINSKEFDIVYISYYEPFAEENYNKLKERFNNVIWIKDIEGIFNAHKKASEEVNSSMFWVVDADADIVDDFDFSYIPDVYDDQVVHVWGSKNPVNNLEYGYGGVKLFPTDMVREADTWGIDFTTGLSSRFKSMPQISCITNFNTDEFSTWRSAFRECVKLTLNNDEESNQRLVAWLKCDTDAQFVEYARKGAEQGNKYAKENINNTDNLNKINDFKWLHEQYNKSK